MLILLLILNLTQAITVESDDFDQFDQSVRPSFICKNGYKEFYKIDFWNRHYQPPQIILQMTKFEIQPALNSTETQFLFNYTDVTNTSFKFFIQCDKNQVYAIRVHWIAFDDYRYEVINFFNANNFQNYTIEHINPYAIYGFASIFSIGFKGPFSFNITIPSITSTTVSINITNPLSQNKNILSIGYQIVLSPINVLGSKYTTTSSYTRNTYSYNLPFSPTLGIAYSNSQNLSLEYYTDIQYRWVCCNWFGYQYQVFDYYYYGIWSDSSIYTNNTHQEIFIGFQSTYVNYNFSLICYHFNVYEKLSDSIPSNSLQMMILETNQQFNSSGSFPVSLDSTLTIVNFQITANCLDTQNIKSSFYFQDSETQITTYDDYLHNCTSQYHIFTYYARFMQKSKIHQRLQINISSSSLNITQIVINYDSINYQPLVAIQFISQ